MAILVLPSCVSDSQDIPDLDEMCNGFEETKEFDSNNFNYTSNKILNLYEERMLGVFQDMCKHEYI